MRVVADQIGAPAIDGAEQKHHVLHIHGVVAKVKEDDGHDLAMPGHETEESRDVGCRDAALEQLLCILGENIEAVEKAKFTLLPAIEDFRRGTGRVRAESGRQDDVGVEHRAERTGIFPRAGR